MSGAPVNVFYRSLFDKRMKAVMAGTITNAQNSRSSVHLVLCMAESLFRIMRRDQWVDLLGLLC